MAEGMNKPENPCEGMITDGWKNCSHCRYVDEITQDYHCLEEIKYQAIIKRDKEWVAWLGEPCNQRLHEAWILSSKPHG